MSEELKLQAQAANVVTTAESTYLEEIKKIDNPAERLKESLEGLEDYGDFDLLETMADGLENMNPESRAAKRIFLQDSEFAEQRKLLKSDLLMWLNILDSDATTASEAVEKCQEAAKAAEKNLLKNLGNVHGQTRQLETAYRSLGQFFINSGQTKLNCLNIINIDKEKLGDVETEKAPYNIVKEELKNSFDRLSLKDNYSLLVSPGYLGSKQIVNKWGKMAYENKVMLVTDYADSPTLNLLNKGLDKANLSDTDAYLANVIMACNYILGRKKSDESNEDEEDLFLPPSAAIAGRMSNTDETPISQGIAGKKYGTIDMAKGTRLDLLKSELTALIDKGVVPMTFEENRVMAFSNRSLYNGATIGLQEYPIVRVFDWIGKVFSNFFNDEAFKNWNGKLAQEIREQVIDFLEDYKGPGKLIEGYSNPKIVRNEKTKDIEIEIELKPFFAAKNFYIKLTGHNGGNGVTEWTNEIK
ncbi:MAG: hypothetical protein IJE60_11095 [Tyzzerella sp.]|nr:hypothetical protein [Tyzzerella sp.]